MWCLLMKVIIQENNMESEKVKEIKKALEDNANYEHHNKLGYIDVYKCKTVAFADILTLINELESENKELRVVTDIANERAYRKKFTDEWRKEYQKELDKQGNGHIAGHPDFDLVYKLYFEQKDRIAELEEDKEKWQRKAVNYYQIAKSYGVECIIDNDIDETLNECEK